MAGLSPWQSSGAVRASTDLEGVRNRCVKQAIAKPIHVIPLADVPKSPSGGRSGDARTAPGGCAQRLRSRDTRTSAPSRKADTNPTASDRATALNATQIDTLSQTIAWPRDYPCHGLASGMECFDSGPSRDCAVRIVRRHSMVVPGTHQPAPPIPLPSRQRRSLPPPPTPEWC